MAAKAVSVPKTDQEAATAEFGKDLFLIAIPMETYRMLADAGAARGLSFSQALQQALSNWVEAPKAGPSLLMENKEKQP